MATALRCPACGSSDLGMDGEGRPLCLACGAALEGLGTSCRACGHLNPADLRRCDACGEPLDVAEHVFDRADRPAAAAWLDRVRAQAPDLQHVGARASQARMRTLLEIDQVREQQQQREQRARQVRDRNLVKATALALVFFAAVLGLALIATLF